MYDFLLPFVNPHKNNGVILKNWFYSVKTDSIGESEKKLGIEFPSQLKEFYQHIGYGSLSSGINDSEHHMFSGSNFILPPDMIVDIFLDNDNCGYMSPHTFELMEPGDLPFFEIADSTHFLFMKLNSDNPNAVWDYDLKITDSFEEFVWRLYYESPDFYGQIITDYLESKKK